MLARIVCFILKHRRGKRIPGTTTMACPRCGVQWEGKPKKVKALKVAA